MFGNIQICRVPVYRIGGNSNMGVGKFKIFVVIHDHKASNQDMKFNFMKKKSLQEVRRRVNEHV